MLAIREGAVYQKLGQMRAVEVSPGIGGGGGVIPLTKK